MRLATAAQQRLGEYYEAAIEASFEGAGVSGAEKVLEVYPYDNAKYAECIGIRKWVALAGINPFEAYCEMRRPGYPTFGSVTSEQIYNELNDTFNPSLLVPGTLYTPLFVNADLGSNKVLQRWPYPEASSNRNENAPEVLKHRLRQTHFRAE